MIDRVRIVFVSASEAEACERSGRGGLFKSAREDRVVGRACRRQQFGAEPSRYSCVECGLITRAIYPVHCRPVRPSTLYPDRGVALVAAGAIYAEADQAPAFREQIVKMSLMIRAGSIVISEPFHKSPHSPVVTSGAHSPAGKGVMRDILLRFHML